MPMIHLALQHKMRHDRRQFRQHAALFGVKIDDSDVKVDKAAASRRLITLLSGLARR